MATFSSSDGTHGSASILARRSRASRASSEGFRFTERPHLEASSRGSRSPSPVERGRDGSHGVGLRRPWRPTLRGDRSCSRCRRRRCVNSLSVLSPPARVRNRCPTDTPEDTGVFRSGSRCECEQAENQPGHANCAEFRAEPAQRAASAVLSSAGKCSCQQEDWLPELGSNQRPTD